MEAAVYLPGQDNVPIKAPVQRSLLYDALSQDKLELILFPTEKCNFRCTYCYEDFEKGRMSRETIAGIKGLIAARAPDLKILHLSWFGGEPLIAYDIMTEISRYAQQLSRSDGFSLIGSVTTNGYRLTEDRMVELADLDVKKIQISLDGDAESHNKTRLRIDGGPTFAVLWSNLLRFNALSVKGLLGDCRVILRLHVHPENVSGVAALISMIENELSPEAFSVHFKAVGHWGSDNDDVFNVFSEKDSDFQSFQKGLYGRLARFQPEFQDDVYVCYAAKANSFTVRSDGTIGKCTVALKDGANNIGQILSDGRLDLDMTKFNAWLHGLSSLNRDDLACPIAKLPRQKTAALAA